MKKITMYAKTKAGQTKILVDAGNLLPHYKNIEKWDIETDPKLAMVSAAKASWYSSKAKAAMAAAFAAVAAITVNKIA